MEFGLNFQFINELGQRQTIKHFGSDIRPFYLKSNASNSKV